MILTIFFYRKNSGWFWHDSRKKRPFSTTCMHNRLKSRCFGEHQSIKVGVLASDTKSRLFSMLESKTTLFFHSSIASVKNDPFIVKLRWAHNSSRIFEPKMTKSLFYRVSRATLEYKGAISKPPRKPAMFILPLFYRWKIDLSSFFRATRLTPLFSRVQKKHRENSGFYLYR